MSKLFFAKMTVPEQYSGKYYECTAEWLNGLSSEDYCFVVYEQKVRALWKAIEIQKLNEKTKVIFSEIHKFSDPKGISIFVSLKDFKLDLTTLNKCQKSTKNKGFHEIKLYNISLEEYLKKNEKDWESYVNDSSNYRKIKVFSENSKISVSPEDVEIYRVPEANKFDINQKSDFFDQDILKKFTDYSEEIRKYKNKKKIRTINLLLESIDDNEVPPEKISLIALYDAFFCKPHLNKNSNNFSNNNNFESLENGEEFDDSENETEAFINAFDQVIFYGVPGSGKSFSIEEKTKNLNETQKIRTVFHPEYSNADFIGQIMPVLRNEKIAYEFTPGPFSCILKKAYTNPTLNYCLIIEEINRGNAAGIFGEIFQLLDREMNSDSINYGWSKYPVNNKFINAYIREDSELDVPDDFSEESGIRLPPNLSILATMNTSDQNVFTLDNAFQRRWDMKLIENVFGDTEEETNQRNAFVDSAKQITWEKFQTAINIKIGKMSEDAGLSSMEDKRLGCWFVKAIKLGNDYIISKDLFAEKVLKYLWDDAFKFCREKVFNGYTNLESLTRDFKGEKEFAVFKDLFSETEN